jgi:hypothetical protein
VEYKSKHDVKYKIVRVDNLSTYYPECLLLSNSLECGGSAAPTSQVCAFPTVIQMITEYRILWRYIPLQWHDVPTKNRDYQ